MKITLAVLVIVLVTNYAQCAKILGIFPAASRSHYILGSSLMKGLAEQGHDVAVISSFSETNPPKNGSYREFVLTGFAEQHDQRMKAFDPFGTKKNFITMIPVILSSTDFLLTTIENVLSHPNVLKLLNSDEQFDLVILEEFKFDALKAIASHYKAPLVLLSTLGANNWVNSAVGNPNPLSYVPDFTIGFSPKMSFFERVANVLWYLFQSANNNLVLFPKQAKLAKKYFPNSPDLSEIVHNISLVLLNSHLSTNAPVPYVPSMIDIGGYHVKPSKTLPKEWQDFMDNAKEGVIYFSLGSNFRGANMPPQKVQDFVNAFAKLKLKVLWKWEDDELPGKPPNVHTAKWLPQQEILAHPNVKLFITHSGLLSTIEIAHHGIPVLAIPVATDQRLNAQRMVNDGIGLRIDFQDVTEAALSNAINQLLSNPEFAKNSKKRSELYHDRLVDPMKTAVYWIEYVLRHGTSHLRVAGLDLSWYQYHILDVTAFLVAVSLVILYINIKICKKLFTLCCKKSTKKLKKQ